MTLRLAVLGLVFALTGCAGQTINEALRRRTQQRSSATLARGARALLQPPMVEAYTLGPLDLVEVEILDLRAAGDVFVHQAEVDPTGQISVPLVGRVQCEGLTVEQIRLRLFETLADRFLADPQVAVKVAEYRSKRVAVLGPVMRPGVVYLQRNHSTVVEALALAGGLSETAGRVAVLVRKQGGAELKPSLEIDIEELTNGDLTQNYTIHPGDVIQVLPAERYYVTGFVTVPGEYAMRKKTSLLEAISIAGGVVDPDASPDETFILRVGEPPIQCDLEAIAAGEAEDPLLVDGDLVQVRQTLLREVVLGLYRFVRGGIGFGYNLASLIPPF